MAFILSKSNTLRTGKGFTNVIILRKSPLWLTVNQCFPFLQNVFKPNYSQVKTICIYLPIFKTLFLSLPASLPFSLSFNHSLSFRLLTLNMEYFLVKSALENPQPFSHTLTDRGPAHRTFLVCMHIMLKSLLNWPRQHFIVKVIKTVIY